MLFRLAFFGLLATSLSVHADATVPVVTDGTGSEFALKKWKIVAGTRNLPWEPGKPDAFELRELGSSTFKDGIVTLVPVSRIQEVSWDYDKQIMTVRVAGLEQPLTGSTKYKDINVLTIEAEVDKGNAGVAVLRFRGGPSKGGIRSVKFPDAKAPEKQPEVTSRHSFLVPAEGKSKAGPATHQATNVRPLYRVAGGEESLSYLLFKKTLKVEMEGVARLSVGAYSAKDRTAECELKLKDGMNLSVTLLTTFPIDGKPVSLLGFVGTAPAGYRLFPVHTISQMELQEEKK